ncbi:MAG: transcription antitermination protein NusB [Ezakiella sp.]|nr:transcription antitermination protein NusB [Ezakiella sp.]MDD7471873.1 transcription antitermination protein NusB [Bacillota bacterium]MDY3923837.1 transcription antitermination protein NusB [Ezakiella sp.]
MDRIFQRELAVKILYAMNIHKVYDFKLLEIYCDIENLDIKKLDFTRELLDAYISDRGRIEDLIKENNENYALKKLPDIDYATIEIALTEIFLLKNPHPVAINEAVEISKKYSDMSSYKIVNSLLGNIVNNHEA